MKWFKLITLFGLCFLLFSCQKSTQDSLQISIDQMTLEEKVGQMFMIQPESLDSNLSLHEINNPKNYARTSLHSVMIETLKQTHVGGIIFFSKNIVTPTQTKQFIQDLQKESKIPLLIGVDEEGGNVARIAKSEYFDVPVFESMESIGNTNNPENAYQVALTIGTYLKELGFNTNFAPVADVNSNPENRVIGKRSFGSDAEKVAEMVSYAIDGYHETNVLTCTKHFPGHGDTFGDTHEGYVLLDKSWSDLLSQEIIPFQKTLDKTDMIMISHISVPEVTGNLPSSLSYEMVQKKLREELGYNGVVIADSMSMGAIIDHYDSAQAAILAIQAGVDIILVPEDFKTAYNGVLQAVNEGTITEERINESVVRILTLKQKSGMFTTEK